MLLAIDVGNTNIHFGLWRDHQWALSWRARTVLDKMPDEYAVLLRNFLASSNIDYRTITGVAVGSVVPPLTLAITEMTRRYLHVEPLVVTSRINAGVRIDIDQPEQAGADRIINAAAVVRLYGAPAIVIDFGTATTFDVVSRDGAYKGGAIAPGIMVAHDALVSRTARLHKIDIEPPPSVIGRNTIHAMQSGIVLGYIALVEGLVTRLKADMQDEGIQVIATGGLATLISQHSPVIDRIAPELTLDGLRIIWELNHPDQS